MDFPVDHLSASSITKFVRCPRQWQQDYMIGEKGPASGPIVVGLLTHHLLAKALMGGRENFDMAEAWAECVTVPDLQVEWDTRIREDNAPELALKHAFVYWDSVGKFLTPMATEKEIHLEIPGVDIPVVGYVDIEMPDRIVDVKTTGYFRKQSVLNPEWKLQANIYQIYKRVPAEFHVLTRNKAEPLILPTHTGHELYVKVPPEGETEQYVRQTYKVMKFYVEEFGDEPWPGNRIHPWAAKYCSLKGKGCCQDG